MIGTTVSHYRVVEHIGSGGMGVVYLAEDIHLHRKVALKFLSETAAQGPEAQERLLREGTSGGHGRPSEYRDGLRNRPQAEMMKETLDWLDRYLGPVQR